MKHLEKEIIPTGISDSDVRLALRGFAANNIELTEDRIRRLARDLDLAEDDTREELVRYVAPEGAFRGMPELLDHRRRYYGMVDSYFRCQATGDWVYLFQVLPEHFEDGKWGKSNIDVSDSRKVAEEYGSPRGVIISAGEKALTRLKERGIGIGHMVWLGDPCPHAIVVDVVQGRERKVLVTSSGLVLGSEDLNAQVQMGWVEAKWNTEDQKYEWAPTEEGQGVLDTQRVPALGEGK